MTIITREQVAALSKPPKTPTAPKGSHHGLQ